jgi:hypothetical protein
MRGETKIMIEFTRVFFFLKKIKIKKGINDREQRNVML